LNCCHTDAREQSPESGIEDDAVNITNGKTEAGAGYCLLCFVGDEEKLLHNVLRKTTEDM
jgi:hypothetical protein